MICRNCGANNIEKSNFCNLCGRNLYEDELTLDNIYLAWKTRRYRQISKKSIEGYELAWKKLECLKDKFAYKIELEDFQNILDEMLPTSHSNQHKFKCLVSQLCKQSFISKGGLRINFAEHLILDGYKSKETLVFSDNNILSIYDCAQNRGNKYWQTAQVILCLIFTGLRPNELFNLKKEDVFLKERYIISKGSKTDAGRNRVIPIISNTWKIFAELYLKATPKSFLFTGEKGAQYNLHNWRERKFYPLMLELGINKPAFYNERKITPYSCRHTYASLAYRAGVEKELLKKMIGHTTWEFTAKTYVHAQVEQYKTEANKMQVLLESFTKEEEKQWF